MFAIDFMNLVNFSNQELFPDQLDRIASRELCSKLPLQWQRELDRLHQEDGCRATFSYDKEWCLKQQCNDEVFAERKEIAKTPIPVDDKKNQQQNRARPAGSVQEVQPSAAPFRGCRQRGMDGAPTLYKWDRDFQVLTTPDISRTCRADRNHSVFIRRRCRCPDTTFAHRHRPII